MSGAPPRRRLRLLSRSYLTHRALWPAIEAAVRRARAGRPPGAVVVDVGCGAKPYAYLFGGTRHIGVDRGTVGARPDVLADALHLPLSGACADIVFCTQVIEHVTSPQGLVAECARILKPGGALVLTGPFYWPLHEEPHDYYRFTGHGFTHLLQSSGMLVESVTPDTGAVTQLAVSLIELLPRWALPLLPLINLLTPLLQRLSGNRLSTLNWVAVARKPA